MADTDAIRRDHALATLIEMFGDTHTVAALERAVAQSGGEMEGAIQLILDAAHHEGGGADNCRDEPPDRQSPPGEVPDAGEMLWDEVERLSPDHSTGVLVDNSPQGPAVAVTPSSSHASLANSSLPNALSRLKWRPGAAPARIVSGKAHPAPLPHITLTAATVRQHLPCEMVLDFLPESVATALLGWLMGEAAGWERTRFIINEKEVQGNHKAELYVDSDEPVALAWAGKTETKRGFTPLLKLVRDMVQERVRQMGVTDWTSNAVVVNEYKDGTEVTGAHTDKLTYIGPLPTIASLTLGAARVFRVQTSTPPTQTYNLVLPHRSLLVMLPPTQERYKHAIPAQKRVVPHPVCGEARYNLTFRMYRREYAAPPACGCGAAAELKPVLRGRGAREGKYYFHCVFGRETKGCGFFEWLPEERVPKGVRLFEPLGTGKELSDGGSATKREAEIEDVDEDGDASAGQHKRQKRVSNVDFFAEAYGIEPGRFSGQR
ncbi:hypothetical protein HDU96_001790 [Phlyctochytrium bullatum]|nr:hypothetical protein HDU96_001790 [Phlyctochytrium bullatum]